MTERAGYGVKKDYKLLKLEQNEFPILCDECMGDSSLLKLLKKPLGQECKICTRPFTVFTWKIQKNTFQTLKTEICSTCAKINNCCQCCIYDLKYHLPIEIRNQLMGDKKVELLVSEGNRDIFAQLASENFDKLKLPYDNMPELDTQDLNLLRKKNLLTYDKKQNKTKDNQQDSIQTIDQLKILDKIKKAKDIYDVDNQENILCLYYVEECNKDDVLEKIYEECIDQKFKEQFQDNKILLEFNDHISAEKILKKFYNNLIINGIKYNIIWQSKMNQQKEEDQQPPEPDDISEEEEIIQQNLKDKKKEIQIIKLINKYQQWEQIKHMNNFFKSLQRKDKTLHKDIQKKILLRFQQFSKKVHRDFRRLSFQYLKSLLCQN